MPVVFFSLKKLHIAVRLQKKRHDFGFPRVNFPWLSGDVPRLLSCGIYISQLVRFARCCVSIFDFHSKSSDHFNTIDTGLHISQASENV